MKPEIIVFLSRVQFAAQQAQKGNPEAECLLGRWRRRVAELRRGVLEGHFTEEQETAVLGWLTVVQPALKLTGSEQAFRCLVSV